MSRIAVITILLAAVAGCTRDNKEFCCLNPADCAIAGVSDDHRDCAEGLACVNHACDVPKCASTGCEPAAPVCDLQTDVCGICTGAGDCARFPTTSVCDPVGGACVGCVVASDCGAAAPVCSGHTCQKCKADTECSSGACADDGSCVPEEQAVYMGPQGVDALPCSRAQPCVDLGFAIRQTSPSRAHIVVGAGNYSMNANPILINSQATSTLRLYVHGGGARLQGGGSDGFLMVDLPVSIRDLELVNPDNTDGAPLSVFASAVLENLDLRGYDGLRVSGQVVAHDLTIHAAHTGVRSVGATTIKRGLIVGAQTGISTRYGTLELENVLIHGSSGLGIDAEGTTGSLSFTTVTETGKGVSGPAGVSCISAGLTFRSSIVWTPTIANQPSALNCSFVNTIVGPIGVIGATNANPLVVNPAAADFHLSSGSPAIDVADQGSSEDFEGGMRPTGLRFDIGADEAP